MPASNLIVRIGENINVKALMNTLLKREINFTRLYNIAEKVEVYRRENTLEASRYQDDNMLFDNIIITNLPEEEANLYRTYEIHTSSADEASELIELLTASDHVVFVELDEEHIPYTVAPNDPAYPNQWGLHKIGIEDAWVQTTGSGIVVAVVDSGVDYDHPDLKANMWKHAQGHHGFNFVNNTTNPMDEWGHGTYVAGIIGAVSNNEQQIAGVAPESKIMAVKVYKNATSVLKDSLAAKGIKYAVDNKAHIINNSWGPGKRQATTAAMNDVLIYAYSKGVIVVFAAGNSPDDVQFYGPANHPLVMAVAATKSNDAREDNSCYGAKIAIAAPGSEILSLWLNSSDARNGYGTSAAAPFVSGTIALLKKLNPRTTSFDTVKTRLKATGDIINTDKPIGKRLNAKKAVVKDPDDLLRIEQQVPFNYSGVTGCAARETAETRKKIGAWINGIKAKYPDYRVLEHGKLWSTSKTKTSQESWPSNKRSCKTMVNMRCYAMLQHK